MTSSEYVLVSFILDGNVAIVHFDFHAVMLWPEMIYGYVLWDCSSQT